MSPVLLLALAALALAWANGANDNFKATATLYGSGTADYEAALTLATGAQVVGSIASVALAGALLSAFSGKGLVPASVVGDPAFLVAVATGAAATVLLATRVGAPVSTTHALLGGLLGAGLAMAPDRLAWGALGGKYFVPLAVSPLLAATAAGLLYPAARFVRCRFGWNEQTWLAAGAVDRAGDPPSGAFAFAGQEGDPAPRGDGRAFEGLLLGVSALELIDFAHTASAFALGFARGLNDTPKILALLVAAGWSGIDPRASLLVVAAAMAAGGVLGARRVAETISHRITGMNRGQGLLANTVGSTLVIGASLLGSPVSTTHVSIGAIFGIGLHTGSADWRVAGGILAAWAATLPAAALVAAAVASLL